MRVDCLRFKRWAHTSDRFLDKANPGLVRWIGERLARSNYRGCPQINVAAEFAEQDHPARLVSRRHMVALRGRLLDIARRLRAAGINTEVQMESRKLAKQFQYASRAGIRFVVLAGEDELARGVVTVKDLLREQQFDVKREELASSLKVELEQARALAGR